MEKYKVLVTYVEAGLGHIVSAEAIANALEKYYPDEVEVVRSYVFEETGDPVLIAHEKSLIKEVQKANRHPISMYFLFFLQKIFPPQLSLKISYATKFRQAKIKLNALVDKYDPDMVVSTHFTPPHCAIEAKRHGADYLVAIYNPDPNVHAWWDKRADLMALNNEDAYEEAIKKRKFRPEKTLLSHFILRENVENTTKDKQVWREKYGLKQDNFTVAIAAGAYAEGHMSEYVKEFSKLDRNLTILAVAGKNDAVYDELTALSKTLDKVDLRVYRFLPDVHELYAASDLFVTKAGPNAILDSVYLHTPVMVNFYASPIERITKDLYVNKYCLGVYEPSPKAAAELLCKMIDDPTMLSPYVENCIKFANTQTGGEKAIVDRLVSDLRAKGEPKSARR